MRKNGFLVITLDFELIWGVFDKINPEEKENYFKNTRVIIPAVLDLFREYQIHATWATVGMLFNRNWNNWKENTPKTLPEYKKKQLSPYRFGEEYMKQPNKTEFCFAVDLIKEINLVPGQEIGTHTYSHYYCLEEGQSLEAFKADLEMSIKVAKDLDITLESLVFPRNQFNREYLQVCHELGIKNVRSNPNHWYWQDTQKDSLISRLFRTGDAYFGYNNKSYRLSDIQKEAGEPIPQKASRLLRPYSSNKPLNILRMRRIKNEMTSAAKNGEVYHLWWHPHNFGDNPEENLKDLREILEHFRYCQDRFGFISVNMKELNTVITCEPSLSLPED